MLEPTKSLKERAKSLKVRPEPGQQLRRVRERLQLKYRDVEEKSRTIASDFSNDEFLVGLSRLADIENRGTLPSIFRLYSLSAIYCLDFQDVLQWYGVDLTRLIVDSAKIQHASTRPMKMTVKERLVDAPALPEGFDGRETSYIGRAVQRWGRLPAKLSRALDRQTYRYGFLGTEDWSMYPILAPGSFLQIDENKRKIKSEGWAHEVERPIYFLEHRNGFRCGWCTLKETTLIWQPHWSSSLVPEIFEQSEIEVIGQIVGVAMRLDLGKRHHRHS